MVSLLKTNKSCWVYQNGFFHIFKHIAIIVILIALASASADDDDHDHHDAADPRGNRPRAGSSN